VIPSFHAGSMPEEEGRAFQQDRLAFFGKVGAVFFLASELAGRYGANEWRLNVGIRPFLAAAAAFAAVWAACRWGRRSVETLRRIDASSLLLAGAALGSLGLVPLAFLDVTYPMVVNVGLLLIARAVIVPSLASRTVVVSVAAAAPALALMGWNAARSGLGADLRSPGPANLAIQSGWLVAALLLSVLASRVTYGLRAEVREASQVGQYTLEEKLGEGGMGVVYRARHARLKRPTAVKLLSPAKVGPQTVERFEREVQITARLTHPNTVAVFDYGRTLDGVFYYAMEYLEGISLEKLVIEDGPQPPGRVVHVLRQIAGALGEAHALGLVHRDITPANVMLCERGGAPDIAKVLDFGLVKDQELPAAPALTQSNMIVGTPLYMAPEALTAPERVGPRTDLYGLGAVGYYLLTGSHVFGGKTVEVFGHLLHTRPAWPSERLGRAIPPGLEAVILSCLEKDPGLRPRDAQALIDALDAAGVEPWTEANARACWAARAAEHARQTGTAPTACELLLASAVETPLTPVRIEARLPGGRS
jgi:eukaryotic-like serine/threonine-protein kinase